MQKYNIALIFGAVLFGFHWNCGNQVERHFAERQDITLTESFSRSPCARSESYIPDSTYVDHVPVKKIRMNFHVMQNGEGEGNFEEAAAKTYIKNLLWVANEKLRKNDKMFLPKGNDTPVLPLRYQYHLYPNTERDEGIYFHRDDDLYYLIAKGKDRNNYSRTICHKYGIGMDSVMNVFVMANHIDSLKSKTYKASTRGVALGNCIKVVSLYYNTKVEEGNSGVYRTEWHGLRNLNHEIGHALGLRHTWLGNDGCDDTPNHPNCWNYGGGRCREEVSNNVMDYNTYKSAWSPCQIGTVHRNMAKTNSRIRESLVKDWCTLDEDYDIEIWDEVEWNGAKDLKGNLIIRGGGDLTIRCRVSIPEGAKVEIWPGGTLNLEGGVLYNDCGKEWEGVQIITQKDTKGIIKMNKKAKLENMSYELDL